MSGPRAARHAPSKHAVTGPGRQLRPQLVRAALLPTLAAGLSGAAAVIFTLQLGGGAGERDARLWPVLTGCALLVLGALAAALLGAQRGAKAVRDRCEALRRSSVRGRQELRTAADRLERGETPPGPMRGGPTGPPLGADPAGVDEFWLLSQELRGAREQAHTTLVRLAGPATPSDSERKVEVFVNLARRLQSLVHREISLLDELEDTVEDPDLLKELFHVDHLATRIRRHAENLAVLGGAASRRQWTRPIDLSEVLRSSVAEVEQYTRVKVVPPAGGSVRGHAVADVVHLLAELVENATVFSAPDTDVVLRAERVTAGIAVEVEDRGLGMPAEEQHRMNALLADPDQISVRNLLADGRIGLFVVSALARRHGIAVELKSNIYGGVLAVLVLPQELLGAEAPSAADAAGGSRATSWGTGASAAMPPLEPVRVTPPEPLPGWGAKAAQSWDATGPRPGPAAPPPSVNRPAPAPAAEPEPGTGAGRRLGPAPAPQPGTRTRPGTAPASASAVAPASASAVAPASAARSGPGLVAGARPGTASEPDPSAGPRPETAPERRRGAASVPESAAGRRSAAAPASDPGSRGRSGTAPVAGPARGSTAPGTSVRGPAPAAGARPGSVSGPERAAGLRSGTAPERGPGTDSAPERAAGLRSGSAPERAPGTDYAPEHGTRIRPGGAPERESGLAPRTGADPELAPGPAHTSTPGATAVNGPAAWPETGIEMRSETAPGRGPGSVSDLAPEPEPGRAAGARRGTKAPPLPVRRARARAMESEAGHRPGTAPLSLPAPRAGDGGMAPTASVRRPGLTAAAEPGAEPGPVDGAGVGGEAQPSASGFAGAAGPWGEPGAGLVAVSGNADGEVVSAGRATAGVAEPGAEPGPVGGAGAGVGGEAQPSASGFAGAAGPWGEPGAGLVAVSGNADG
ncbi:ATP-binding protein, partial [Streptomyces sp. NPDC048269]|uniref:ATP-binding protein n=1 Tax=Streptomyces sp. NPDC048269 TaxID=3155753 RepID=UPI00342AD3F8